MVMLLFVASGVILACGALAGLYLLLPGLWSPWSAAS